MPTTWKIGSLVKVDWSKVPLEDREEYERHQEPWLVGYGVVLKNHAGMGSRAHERVTIYWYNGKTTNTMYDALEIIC